MQKDRDKKIKISFNWISVLIKMEKDSFSDGQNSEFKSVNYEFSYHSSIDPKRTDNSRIYKNKRDVSSESGQDRTFGPWTSYYE